MFYEQTKLKKTFETCGFYVQKMTV